ncbi:MAG TPA: putative manganese-dependent inorganic diphosphatase, partial [Chloroflexota bacterium]|nr:putative manganese-dependent inorganic diphosphatase [Chloroflexota bacterium]
ISVPHDTYTTVRLINMSIPVHYIMRRDVPSVQPDDLVEEARQLLRIERTIPVVDDDRRVVGIVSRSDLLNPNRRRVYLVDHNERGQSIDGIDEAEVLGVIDHHRVADFQTSTPPLMRIEPVGSTNTIIAKLFREANIAIPPAIAGVMLGGIRADTLIFQSPTATDEDRRVAEELAIIVGIDVETYGRDILRVASNLAERTAEELLTTDFKEFKFGEARFGVGVIEIADASALAARRKELLYTMESLRARSGYTSILLAIVDIAQKRTEILVQGHANAVAAAFDAPLRDGSLIELSGIYSRKKQIVPLLSRVREAIAQR